MRIRCKVTSSGTHRQSSRSRAKSYGSDDPHTHADHGADEGGSGRLGGAEETSQASIVHRNEIVDNQTSPVVWGRAASRVPAVVVVLCERSDQRPPHLEPWPVASSCGTSTPRAWPPPSWARRPCSCGTSSRRPWRTCGRTATAWSGSTSRRQGSTSSSSTGCARRSVTVTNARGVFDRPIAEFVLAAVLAHAKLLHESRDLQRDKVWRHRETRTVVGARALIVGTGAIGRETARLLRAVGMEVRGAGRTARADDVDFGEVVASADLVGHVGWCDYLVNAAPLTEQTRGLINADVFAAMRPSAHLINVGRGADGRRTRTRRGVGGRRARRRRARRVRAGAAACRLAALVPPGGGRLGPHGRRRDRLARCAGPPVRRQRRALARR